MNSLKKIANQGEFSIDANSTIKEAMAIMHRNKNGSVVLIENLKPVAIITESDIVNTLKANMNLNKRSIEIATRKVISTNENRPVEYAFDLLIQHSIRRIILVDNDGLYKGIVLQKDLFEYLEEDVYKIDLKVSDIIKTEHTIQTVQIDDTIKKAVNIMQEYQIGSVVVLDANTHVGIITEKDILKLTYYEVELNQKVATCMSSPIITVKVDSLVTNVIELMKVQSIRRVAVLDNEGKIVSIVTNRDILKHIKGNYTRILQNKIKHAQEIMDFLPEPIIEIFYSKNEEVIYWMNEQAHKLFGNDLIEQKVTRLFKIEDWEEIKSFLLRKKQLENKSVEIKGSIYEISGTISKNVNTNFIKLIFKDVTNYENEKTKLQNLIDTEIERRMDSEYLLMQQAKLATMGEMIGHIAHQWRQPLAQLGGIFMNLESAYAFNELDEKYLNQRVLHGNDLLKYMSNTIEDFRNFFEPNRTKEVFNLSEYIQNAVNIINASLTYHHINLDFHKPSKTINTTGFPSEFSQVILNILANAQDVLVQEDIKNPFIKIVLRETKDKVYIDIEDNGGGINLNVIDKVFDIYFTTKSKKEGTGLGLYISKLIIETKLSGEINVSNSDVGAVFTIELSKDNILNDEVL